MCSSACLHAFPLAGLTGATFGLWTEEGRPLRRKNRDRISLRAPRSALVMTVLSGIAAAGLLLRLVLDQAPALWPGDLIFGACEAVLLAASCLLLRAGKRTSTRVWEAE